MAESGNTAGGGDFYKMGQQMGPDQLDTGTADILGNVSNVLMKQGSVIDAEIKVEEKNKKTARDKAGVKISNAFIAMGPQLKQLGQESYTQAQNEAGDFRERMATCIDSEDVKCQQNIMVELNAWKERHAGDASNLDTLVSSWEDESVSTAAMTEDQMRVMENFATNKSRRVIYSDEQPPQMQYEWDVPDLDDNGEQKTDKDGNPLTKVDGPYSMQDMQDMIHTKETVSGVEMIDIEQRYKEEAQEGNGTSYGAMKRQIGEIIPMDEGRIRDWLHGNPAEHHGLDVHGYLVDLMSSDFGTFDKLGIDLTLPEYAYLDLKENGGDGDGVVEAGEVPQAFKDELIKNVMDVKDLEISHGIITEIYTRRIHNNVAGKSTLNKNYHPEDDTGLGTPEEKALSINTETKVAQQEKLAKLQSLADPKVLKGFEGANVEYIANELGLDPKESILNPKTGQTESIATYIANAQKKPAKSQAALATEGMTALQKIAYAKEQMKKNK